MKAESKIKSEVILVLGGGISPDGSLRGRSAHLLSVIRETAKPNLIYDLRDGPSNSGTF